MAASEPLIDDIIKELDCVICLAQKRLHLLPCAHRCCQECIGNLAGDDGEFQCPICRLDVTLPVEGFPVCLLSEFLREKVYTVSRYDQGSARSSSSVREFNWNVLGSATKCSSCKVRPAEARCRACLCFLCYRCVARSKCEKTFKHDSDDLDDLSAIASSQLNGWTAKTKREITALEEVVRQKQREIDAKILQRAYGSINKQSDSSEVVRQKQRQIEAKKKVLQACEGINKHSDSAEKITLIEMIYKVKIVSSTIGKLPGNPTGLRFFSLHPADSLCSSVSHVGNDQLALGCSVGLKLFNKETAEMKLVANLNWLQVAEYKGELYLSYQKEDKRVVARYDAKKHKGTEDIFSFRMDSTTVCQITANQRYIVATDQDNQKIQLYKRTTRAVLTKALPGLSMMFNVKFSPANSLLVTGSGNSVTKYIIPENPEDELFEVWTVKLATMVVGLAVTEREITFVAGQESKEIYVISEMGVRLTTLRHDYLPDVCEGISIRGDELAVAGWDDNNFLLFKIVGSTEREKEKDCVLL